MTWVSADYLHWWVKDAPQPLITQGSTADPIPGALGQPGTQVVAGGTPQDFGGISGLRATLAFWCDEDRVYGMEGGYAFLTQTSRGAAFASPSSGTTVFAQPVVFPGAGERAFAASPRTG